MKKIYYLLLVLLFMGFYSSVSASHLMGGNITYTCTSSNTYLVTFSLYRDCSGIGMPNSITPYVSVTAPGCYSGTISINATLIPNTGIDITPVCPQFPATHCPGSPPGTVMVPLSVQEYIYQGTLTLPSSPQCSNWVIAYSDCCRNDDITTGAANQPFYITSTLNNTSSVTPCNNSPVFLNPPVPFTCANKLFTFNHGVSDPDGDSLSFSLVSCMQSSTNAVTYNPGLSATQPLYTTGPVTIDPISGTISLTPNGVQIGVICVRVDEFRNGVKIGEYIRDLQIVVSNCNNPAPTLSGINGSSDFDTIICIGQNISFDVTASDPNPFQVTTLTWNQAIPGATFTSTSGQTATGTFSWTPPPGTTGIFVFTITAKDDGCPIPASTTQGFVIEIRNPYVDLGPDLTVCAGSPVGMTAPFPKEGVDFIQYQWLPTNGISNDTILSPTFSPTSTTTYTLVATAGSGCTASDEITINVDDVPTLTVSGDVELCEGETTTLSATTNAANVQWTGTGLDDPNSTDPIASPTQTQLYYVTASSTLGCEITDSVLVTVNPLPTVEAGTDANICSGETAQLTASGDAGLNYDWQPSGGTGATATVSPSATQIYTLTVTDANGCTATDIATVNVSPAPNVIAAQSDTIDFGEIVNITASPNGAQSYSWSTGETSQQITVSPEETTMYIVTVVDANGCVGTDTALIVVKGDIVFPNAFAPEGQVESNWTFKPIQAGPVEVEYFRIYNRWGQMIFEANSAQQGWDGTFNGELQPPGNYTYVLKGITKESPDPVLYQGSVTLLR